MCSNWIFAVGNLSGECKFLRKFQWCPICVRVEIALIRNTERSFFVNYNTNSFKGGGENSGTFVRTDPNPNHAFHLHISTALLYLENRENNCILSAEDRHKSNLTLRCSYRRQRDLPARYRGSCFGIHQYQSHSVLLLSTDHSCIGMNQEH